MSNGRQYIDFLTLNGVDIQAVLADPNGVVNAPVGSIATLKTAPFIWVCAGGMVWNLVYPQAALGGLTSEFWVDASAAPGGTGSATDPFNTPQDAVDAVVLAGSVGLIHLVPGVHGAVAIPAGLTLTFDGGDAPAATSLGVVGGVTLTDACTVAFRGMAVGTITFLGASGFAGVHVTGDNTAFSVIERDAGSTSVGSITLRTSSAIQINAEEHLLTIDDSVFSNVAPSTCGQLAVTNGSFVTGAEITTSTGSASVQNSDVDTDLTGTVAGSVAMDAASLGYYFSSGAVLTNLTPIVDPFQYLNAVGYVDSAFAGTQNDFNVFGNGFTARLTGTLTPVITSIVSAEDGRLGLITNTGADNITFTHNAGGTAANRILCPGDIDYILGVNDSAMVWYDPAATRWRLFGTSVPSASYFSQITAAPAANQNDYAPTGWSRATSVLLAPTTPVVITGLSARSAGTVVALKNTSTYPVVFMTESAASTAANRISAIGGTRGHIIVLPGDNIQFVYNGTTSRWNVGSFARVINSGGTLRDLIPNRSSAGPVGLWLNFASNGGTWTAPTPTNASYPSSLSRTRFPTTAAINNVSGIRSAQQSFLQGNGAGIGGFAANIGWGLTTITNTTPTFFMGFNGSTSSAGANDATTLIDMVGFGLQGGDANWQVMRNDAAGVATKIDLGAGFPRDATAWFSAWIYADPNSAEISYAIWRMDDLTVTPAVGVLTTDLPTAAMQIQLYVCNLGEANVQAFDFNTMVVWTPS